jgi:hypothetical protein
MVTIRNSPVDYNHMLRYDEETWIRLGIKKVATKPAEIDSRLHSRIAQEIAARIPPVLT